MLVVENDDTYRLRHFDSSLNPLSDIAVDFKDANYTSLSDHENSTYVVSGSENDFMHYLITDGSQTASYTDSLAGIIETSLSVSNGGLISVGYRYTDSYATIMKTVT